MYFKYLLILSAFITIFCSCEEDDICIDSTTPQLIINIKNPATLEPQSVDSLFVDYELNSEWVRMYQSVDVDSLTLALPIEDVDFARYRLYRRSVNPVIDYLQLNYQREEAFVSKACGFAIHYKNITVENSNNWLEGIIVNTEEISNEEETHLILLY